MINYEDRQLKERRQVWYLLTAGYTIKLIFEPEEHVFFKRKLLEDIWEVWGKGGFLETDKNTKKRDSDFELKFKSGANKVGVFKKGGKDYLLTFDRPGKKRIDTYYHVSLAAISLILKEIVGELIKKGGFILHTSSVLDENGNLFVFMAKSGGGKTTAADVLCKNKGFVKFSDDNLFIRKLKGKWIYFSPAVIEKGRLPKKGRAKRAKLFFVKKSKKAKVNKLKNERNLLKRVLEQVWLKEEEMENDILKNAMKFVSENDFYNLTTSLNSKEMKRVVYEV